MPKLRRMFSSTSAPFWWPTKTTRCSPMRAKPPTSAASSPKSRSPWSSTTSVGHQRRAAPGCAAAARCGPAGRAPRPPREGLVVDPRAAARRPSRRPRSRRAAVASRQPRTAPASPVSHARHSASAPAAAVALGDRVALPSRSHRAGAPARLQVAQQAAIRRVAQLGARHDLVDEAVAEEELGALEALRAARRRSCPPRRAHRRSR